MNNLIEMFGIAAAIFLVWPILSLGILMLLTRRENDAKERNYLQQQELSEQQEPEL